MDIVFSWFILLAPTACALAGCVMLANSTGPSRVSVAGEDDLLPHILFVFAILWTVFWGWQMYQSGMLG